jgi:hypothetical protein
MPLKSTILSLTPTSYWPLDDDADATSCLDAMGLTNACLPGSGVTLAAVPFGASSAPLFDGAIGSRAHHCRRAAIFAAFPQRPHRRGLDLPARARQREYGR